MFNRIIHGFLIGLGFSIALILVIGGARYIYMKYVYPEQMSETMLESGLWKEYSDEAGLSITEHSPIQTEFNLEVVGVIQNEGEDTWDGISIEVELFDATGKFIDECTEYISSPIAPSERENFKVSCGGCEKRPLSDFDHYEISIKDAHFDSPTDGI